jgi:Zn finger protein HypA/HybF involved in hydrogenase expression
MIDNLVESTAFKSENFNTDNVNSECKLTIDRVSHFGSIKNCKLHSNLVEILESLVDFKGDMSCQDCNTDLYDIHKINKYSYVCPVCGKINQHPRMKAWYLYDMC